MIYVGIDVASTKHDCYLETDNGEVFSKPFEVDNNKSGYEKLHKNIQRFMESTNDSNVRIGLESTGHYSKNILLYLVNKGYSVAHINPILTNMERKSTTVRKTKTDKVDSVAICRFLDKNRIDFKPYTLQLYHIEAMKSLSRQRFSLVKQRSLYKITLHRFLTIVFPEFIGLFSNLYVESSLRILEAYPTPNKIVSARETTLNKLIHSRSSVTAKQLKELALNSIGQTDDYLGFQIVQIIKQLRFIDEQINAYEKEIEITMNKYGEKIMSIPGVSYVTGALILSEIGDISNFSSADKLLAFAGLDPSVYQSGNFEANNKISKRGSKYLRWAIHQAAAVIWRFDKTFEDYYKMKKASGKHHYVIIGHIDKKLVRVIYSILKNNKEFEPKN